MHTYIHTYLHTYIYIYIYIYTATGIHRDSMNSKEFVRFVRMICAEVVGLQGLGSYEGYLGSGKACLKQNVSYGQFLYNEFSDQESLSQNSEITALRN